VIAVVRTFVALTMVDFALQQPLQQLDVKVVLFHVLDLGQELIR